MLTPSRDLSQLHELNKQRQHKQILGGRINKPPREAEGDGGKKLMINKEERRKKNGGSEKSLLRYKCITLIIVCHCKFYLRRPIYNKYKDIIL
jgi:hypothetical protein